jgi:hypothetical protein
MSGPVWMQNTNWRETGRQVKVGPLDGRLMIFVILLLLFPGKIILALTIIAMAFFYVLEYMGYTLPNAYRKLSALISGKKRNGVHYWRQHKFRF